MNFGKLLTVTAQKYPKKVSIVCGDDRLSFMELKDTANRLANGLIEIGLSISDRVVIMLPNCLNVAISVAAVAKGGGIILPVSTRLTGQEIKYLIDDSNPFAVIYSPDCRDLIKDLSGLKNCIKITTNVA